MAKDEPLDETLDEERDEDGQIYVDRDKIDFDPDDGLLSGTAIDGTSDIPDPDGGTDSDGDDDSGTDSDGDNSGEGEHDKEA